MDKSELQSDHFKINLEFQEAAYWEAYYKSAPGEFREDFGLGYRELGGAAITYAAKIDILAFNRVIGWGLNQAGDEKEVDEMITLYQDAGIRRFFVQLSPHAKPAELPQILKDKRFYHYNNWVKFYRPVEDFPASNSPLRIEQIDRRRSGIFSDIIITSFDWPDFLKPLISAPVGTPGWKHYLAYEGEVPTACAALFLRDTFATLALAATLPQYQGRGAQSALISRRFQDAAQAGCQWMFTETAQETAERSVASFRNMQRHGFSIAYLRPNYLFEFDGQK
jgi:GNAT superfamily N-acetyltransferase